MKIWVDADACPKVIKDILFKAADRTQTEIIFVANQWLRLPQSAFITFILVSEGSDAADDKIADNCKDGDLIITADIPLAARAIEKNALALDPKGKIYTKSNIKEILGMRDFMDSLRGSGIETGGSKGFGSQERNKFANELDKFITKNL